MKIQEVSVKRNAILVLLILFSAFILTACLDSRNQQSSTQDSSTATEGLVVTLQTNPLQPKVGQVELIVEVKDASNREVDGATVTVWANMLDHSMGDLTGQATSQARGRYAIRANLSMAGDWQVEVQVKTAEEDVRRTFEIAVQ